MFIFRETIRSLRRSPLGALIIAMTIGVGVGLTAVFGFVAYSAHSAIADIQRSITIDVYFDPVLSNEEAQAVFTQQISTRTDVSESRFISKEDALREYEAGTGQDVRSVLGDNPLPAGASLKLKEPSIAKLERTLKEVRAIAGVAEASTDQELGKAISSNANSLSELTTWLGIMIGIVILLVTIVSTKLSVERRKGSLRIMRLMGASRWKIGGPFILEGAIAGALGGLLAIAVSLALDGLALRALMPNMIELGRSEHSLLLACAILCVAIVLGVFGSAISLATANKKQ